MLWSVGNSGECFSRGRDGVRFAAQSSGGDSEEDDPDGAGAREE